MRLSIREWAQLVRFGIRSLCRAPGFVVTASVTLALGIGLSTAVFTVTDALLIRRLPMHEQDRLVMVEGANWPLAIADLRAFTERSQALQNVAYVDYYGSARVPVIEGDNVVRLRRALVSGNYFDVLGTPPVLGRTLQRQDNVVGAAPVVVISNRTWQNHYGGDRNVIGRRITLQLDGVAAEIVGVIPEGLEYPADTDFWAAYAPARLRTARDSGFAALNIVGRLATGRTASQAADELTAYYRRADGPQFSREFRGTANTLPRVILGDTRPALLVFASAAALLLLITCINVVNLLLVRGVSRLREIAVRGALGAERWHVMTQLMVENALLAIAGGVLGILIGAAAVKGFIAFAPATLPLIDTIRLNQSALAGAVAITAFALLLFGLAPALVTARGDLQDVLRSGTRQSSTRAARLVREALVTAQITLAVMLLSAAALLGKSFANLQNATLAFESSQLLIAELGLRYDRYETLEQQLSMLRALHTRLRATPGVSEASPVVAVPFSGTHGWTGRAAVPGQAPDDAAGNPVFNMELVTPEYFRTFGLRVLQGRTFTDADRAGAEPVIVVSETMARRYWPNQDPLGKQLRMGMNPERSLTVVGIVPDTRYRDLREAMPSVYFPLAQSFFPFAPTTFAIRTSVTPAALVPALRTAIDETAPGVVLASAAPFKSHMQAPLAQPRLNAFLLAMFASAAVALAAVGLFAVMATLVRQRTRELGIRMALGATSLDVQWLMLHRGLVIGCAGVGAGVGGALLVNRYLAAVLYEVTPTDPPTLSAVALLVTTIVVVAALVPARVTGRVSPAIALRSD